MDIKQVENISKIAKQIEQLDFEITSIEKSARIAAGNEDSFELDLRTINSQPRNLHQGSSGGSILGMLMNFHKTEGDEWKDLKDEDKKEIVNISFSLNNLEMLHVLGALVQIKKDQRQNLINQLQDLGVNI